MFIDQYDKGMKSMKFGYKSTIVGSEAFTPTPMEVYRLPTGKNGSPAERPKMKRPTTAVHRTSNPSNISSARASQIRGVS
jgi:hypothetical protein